MKCLRTGICTAALAAALVTDATAGCEAQSGGSTVALLELYTSEGCDSCPPADRWLADLPGKGFGLNRVVPLAFHVDYWNYLGWVDPYAQSLFTQRQRDFARRTNAPTVYTPEFVLNGREYRRWSKNNFADELAHLGRAAPRADIVLKLNRAGSTLDVTGEATLRDTNAAAAMYLALYENDLQTRVLAGENRGRELSHQFVVRRLIGPIAFDATGKARARESIRAAADWRAAKLGVAAFVQEANGTAILQALALGACP
jgi:hypothetical protein